MKPGAATRERTNEASLITACRQGDRQAFRALFDAWKDRVYAIAVSALHGDRTAAEDITQEVFVRVFTRIGQFRNEAEFSTWLHRLTVNACIDELRKRKRLVPLDDGHGEIPAESPYARLEDRKVIEAALAELSPELRLPVLLKYYAEMSYEEMAEVMDCPKGTIASRLNRSLKILARKLAPLRGGDGE